MNSHDTPRSCGPGGRSGLRTPQGGGPGGEKQAALQGLGGKNLDIWCSRVILDYDGRVGPRGGGVLNGEPPLGREEKT